MDGGLHVAESSSEIQEHLFAINIIAFCTISITLLSQYYWTTIIAKVQTKSTRLSIIMFTDSVLLFSMNVISKTCTLIPRSNQIQLIHTTIVIFHAHCALSFLIKLTDFECQLWHAVVAVSIHLVSKIFTRSSFINTYFNHFCDVVPDQLYSQASSLHAMGVILNACL